MRAPLYVMEQGSRLSRAHRRLLVTKQEETLAKVPVLQISQVLIFGNVSVTTPALRLLLDEGVDVAFLSLHGHYYGRLVGQTPGNVKLRVNQILRSQDPTFALTTAREMVRGKLHNMRVLLLRYARRLNLEPVGVAAQAIAEMADSIERSQGINSLMGMEGRATAAYFSVWKDLLKTPWRFEKRQRRPPPDPVNVLMSFGYTLLTNNIMGAIQAAGLDPYVGYLHQVEYNRPSLALDLMEEFRPLVVDSVVMRCFNNDLIHPDDFAPGPPERPIVLSDAGSRRFIQEMERRLTSTFQHPETGEEVNYRRLFLLQAYRLARSLESSDGQPIYKPIMVR